MAGTLFIVGTPIGNLEDLTFRALRTLREVDAIAAEDTRRTSKLLAHYEIRKPLLSVREHNEVKEAARLVQRLAAGQSIAFVTDAGTPGIADPGARLVHAARLAGIQVVPIPGPSAVATALSVAGMAADEFVFMGFPPRSGKAREDWLARLGAEGRVVAFFEAPHRIKRTAKDLQSILANRPIYVFRELTKINESLVISTNNEWTGELKDIGEIVVVVGPGDLAVNSEVDGETAATILGRLIDNAGLDEEMALEMAAHVLRSEPLLVKKAAKRHRYSVSRQKDRSP